MIKSKNGYQKTGNTSTQSNALVEREEVRFPVSLRDWFAGMALQAVLHDYCDSNSKYAELATKECYLFADAMLKAREADNG